MKIRLDLLMTQQQSAYDFKGSEGFRRVQDCYRKKGGAQEKKGLFLSRAIVFGRGRIFIMQIASSSYGGRWRLPPCIDQKIPDWLVD